MLFNLGACLNPVTVGKESTDLYEGNPINHQACHECTLPYKGPKARQKKTKGRFLLFNAFYITLNFAHIADVRFDSVMAECSMN